MTVTILQGNNTEEIVALSLLISLEDAGFEDADLAMRDIDEEHIARLIEVPAHELPAIETVRVSIDGVPRYAVIDGYHRWERGINCEDEGIRTIARSYASENEVIEAAFQANYKHGLNISKGTRSSYALWLFMSDTENTLSMREIARRVGLNVSTVSRAIKNTVQRNEENAPTRETNTATKLIASIHRFMDDEDIETVEDGAQALYKAVAAMPKEKHVGTVEEIRCLKMMLDTFNGMVSSHSKKQATAKR